MQQKLFTTNFFLLSLSHFLFAASFCMIIPELPAYLTSLGGAEYKGLIISLFTLTAGISRPFSGKLTDTIGRRPVLIIGTAVCVVCSLIYPFVTSLFAFLALRLAHGFSTGFKPTANIAYVADIVPEDRRGEAMGVMGMCFSGGSSIGPVVGSAISNVSSLDMMFYASSLAAVISTLIIIFMPESLKDAETFQMRHLKIHYTEIFDRSAIPPAVITLLLYFTFGGLLTIVPDYSDHLGIRNKGLYLTSFTAMIFVSRFIGGKLSDIYGRVIVIIGATVIVIIAVVLFGMSWSPATLLAFSGLIGFGFGFAGPAIFAWATDRSDPATRGRAFATIYIAIEIGIGVGALLSAWMFDDQPDQFGHYFYFCGVLAAIGLVYMWRYRNRA